MSNDRFGLCGAQKAEQRVIVAFVSCCFMLQYAQHYHPSVRHFAEQIVQGTRIEYKGDPLQDFTLVR